MDLKDITIMIQTTESSISLARQSHISHMRRVDLLIDKYNKYKARYDRLNINGNRRRPEYLIDAKALVDEVLLTDDDITIKFRKQIEALEMTLKTLVEESIARRDAITNPTDPEFEQHPLPVEFQRG